MNREPLTLSRLEAIPPSVLACPVPALEFLQSAAAQTVGAIGDALRAVTPVDIMGWFGHCGYRYKQA